MVLTLDRITKKVCQRVGDRNFDRLPEVRDYVEDTVIELTMMLRKGAVYETATLTVSNGEVILPDDCAAVLKIFDGGSTFFEIVDIDEWRSRSERGWTLPTAQVIEDVPNWRIRLLNYDSTSNLTVDYLITKKNPAIMPEYYEAIIKAGAVAKYHLNRGDIDRYRIHDNFYNKLKNDFKENQSYNTGKESRTKGLPEIELQQANNSLLSFQRNDFIGLGGWY